MTLTNALRDMSPDSGATPDYARGVLVGAMAVYMEINGLDFGPALKAVSCYMPRKVMKDSVPLAWQGQLSVLGIKLV
jgi:hypothetical protein